MHGEILLIQLRDELLPEAREQQNAEYKEDQCQADDKAGFRKCRLQDGCITRLGRPDNPVLFFFYTSSNKDRQHGGYERQREHERADKRDDDR